MRVELRTCARVLCMLSVLGAGAGAKRRRAKPVDPAGEVSCAGG